MKYRCNCDTDGKNCGGDNCDWKLKERNLTRTEIKSKPCKDYHNYYQVHWLVT